MKVEAIRNLVAQAIENKGVAETAQKCQVLGYTAEYSLQVRLKTLTDSKGDVMYYQSMKQQQFNMDLDKLLSGNYALVPLKPSDEMMSVATKIFYSTPYGTDAHTLIAQLWAMMVAQGVQS